MKSMTGFGRHKTTADGMTVEVELKSWNHKGFDSQVKIAEAWSHLEPVFRDTLAKRGARGKVSCSVRIRGKTPGEMIFNQEIIAGLVEPYKRAADKLAFTTSVSLADIMAIPGAVELIEGDTGPVEALLLETLAGAIEAWDASRSVEGARMRTAIIEELTNLEATVGIIEERNVIAPSEQKARLRIRVAELLSDAGMSGANVAGAEKVDDKRLEFELALLAEKADVKEEIIRLRAHIAAARKLSGPEASGKIRPVGAELAFVLQELLRETNTVGSKTQDIETVQAVIVSKTAIDRIKEIAANVV